MAKYWHKKKHYYKPKQPRKLTEFEKFSLVVAAVVFVIALIYFTVAGFLRNCVFHWPVQWDVSACWHEQIAPAQQKAAQAAEPFIQ